MYNTKINSIVLLMVVVIMYSLFEYIDEIEVVWVGEKILTILIGGLSSLGIYRGLLYIFQKLLNNWNWLNKVIRRKGFLKGTWGGYFIGYNQDLRYFIETIDQDADSIRIKGTSYDAEGNLHAQWQSHAAVFDENYKRLIYSFTTDIISRAEVTNGLALIDVRVNDKGYPCLFEGYTVEVLKGKKLPLKEVKLSDFYLDHEKAIEKVKEVFKLN